MAGGPGTTRLSGGGARVRLTGGGPCSGRGPGCSSGGQCRSSLGKGCPASAPRSLPHTLPPGGHAGTASAGSKGDFEKLKINSPRIVNSNDLVMLENESKISKT